MIGFGTTQAENEKLLSGFEEQLNGMRKDNDDEEEEEDLFDFFKLLFGEDNYSTRLDWSTQ